MQKLLKDPLYRYDNMKKAHDANLIVSLKKRITLEGPSPVKVGDKFGFQESVYSRKIIIQPQYTEVHRFHEELAAAAVGEKERKLWGFIDMKGEWVIHPSYQKTHGFTEGAASVKVNDKFGYIDKEGNFIIKPQFDEAFVFTEGIAKVKIGNKFGYVNKLGEVFMEP